LWEAVLPDEVRLPVELERVDRLFDDAVFFGPFVPLFHPTAGRRSTPMETYLRLMFLKFRHGLGYESLCRGGRGFNYLAAVLPDPVGREGPALDDVDEVTTRCGTAAVDGLNEVLLAKAVQAKVLRTGSQRSCGCAVRRAEVRRRVEQSSTGHRGLAVIRCTGPGGSCAAGRTGSPPGSGPGGDRLGQDVLGRWIVDHIQH